VPTTAATVMDSRLLSRRLSIVLADPLPEDRPPFVQSTVDADDQLKVLHTASEPIVTDAVQSDGLKLVPDTVSSAPDDPAMAFKGEAVSTGGSNVRSFGVAVPTKPPTVSRNDTSVNCVSAATGSSAHDRLVPEDHMAVEQGPVPKRTEADMS